MNNIFIKSESRYPVNRKEIRKIVGRILAERKIVGKIEVAVIVVGDRKMKVLNKKYRKIRETTPVLAFPLDDPKRREFPFPFSSPDNVLRLGDVVISFPHQWFAVSREEYTLAKGCVYRISRFHLGFNCTIWNNYIAGCPFSCVIFSDNKNAEETKGASAIGGK